MTEWDVFFMEKELVVCRVTADSKEEAIKEAEAGNGLWDSVELVDSKFHSIEEL